VTPVATARAICQVRELCAEWHIVHVDSVAETVVGEVVEAGDQNTSDRYAQGNVDRIVDTASSIKRRPFG